jgi:hypothetical protein
MGIGEDMRRWAKSRPEGPAPTIDTLRESGVAWRDVDRIACDAADDFGGEKARDDGNIKKARDVSSESVVRCTHCIVI